MKLNRQCEPQLRRPGRPSKESKARYERAGIDAFMKFARADDTPGRNPADIGQRLAHVLGREPAGDDDVVSVCDEIFRLAPIPRLTLPAALMGMVEQEDRTGIGLGRFLIGAAMYSARPSGLSRYMAWIISTGGPMRMPV